MPTIDHRSIIAALTAEERRTLLQQSDIKGLRHLTLHLGAIAVFTTLILREGGTSFSPFWSFSPLLPLLMFIQGILIAFLFTLLHETVHRTPFRSDGLNIWVGRLCGFLVFLGPDWFRYFHFAHHRYTHDPDNDPELASPKPRTVWQYLKYLSGLPETLERFKTLFRNAFKTNQDTYVPERGKAKVMREARVMLALYALLIGGSITTSSTLLVWTWWLPLLLGGPFLRGYLLAEHAFCPHVASMLENTRTTFTNTVVRFLAWNMPYHAEHHAYPAVPFHQLPAFHQFTKAHLANTENGYLKFNKAYYRHASEQKLDVSDPAGK
ncbi:MAG: fatty acid desaturase [Rhizobiaceae bacterium]